MTNENEWWSHDTKNKLTLKYFVSTVNWVNCEWWGGFERCSICSFNELYYPNGRVYQKLYFLHVVYIHHCDHFQNQNVHIWVKTFEQRTKNLIHVFFFFNCCQTSIWQHPMQSWHDIKLCGIAKSCKWPSTCSGFCKYLSKTFGNVNFSNTLHFHGF